MLFVAVLLTLETLYFIQIINEQGRATERVEYWTNLFGILANFSIIPLYSYGMAYFVLHVISVNTYLKGYFA